MVANLDRNFMCHKLITVQTTKYTKLAIKVKRLSQVCQGDLLLYPTGNSCNKCSLALELLWLSNLLVNLVGNKFCQSWRAFTAG